MADGRTCRASTRRGCCLSALGLSGPVSNARAEIIDSVLADSAGSDHHALGSRGSARSRSCRTARRDRSHCRRVDRARGSHPDAERSPPGCAAGTDRGGHRRANCEHPPTVRFASRAVACAGRARAWTKPSCRIYAADDLRLASYLDERFSAASQPTDEEIRQAGEAARPKLVAERRQGARQRVDRRSAPARGRHSPALGVTFLTTEKSLNRKKKRRG